MQLDKFSLNIVLIIALTVLLFSSCGAPSKRVLSNRISRGVNIGTTKTDVLKFIETLERNGTRAVSSGYVKTDSPETMPINGENVEIEGTISVEFRGCGVFYCGSFAILYFDKSDKLISHVVDAIYC